MLRLLLPVRLIATLAIACGGLVAARQPAIRALLPPSVAQALALIQDKQAELLAAFGQSGA